MSTETYNLYAMILLSGALVALVIAGTLLVAGIVGWRSRLRNRFLAGFGAGLVTFVGLVAVQQVLLFQYFLPSLGAEQRRLRQEQIEKLSIVRVGDSAPSFAVTDTHGKTFDLEQVRGKVVLLNFFATWCGPCRMELPQIQKLWDENRSNDQFALIVLGREETTETVSDFQKKLGFTFPMAPDPDRSVFSLYAKEAIPRTYLISADGKICFSVTGFDEEQMKLLELEVAKQLGQPTTTNNVE